MYHVLFIGSNPATAATSTYPFDISSKSGKTIREWIIRAGITGNATFYNVANRRTPNNRPLKKSEIEAALPMLQRAVEWEKSFQRKDIYLVAVGKTAQQALTLLRLPFYAMPHPSGLNRQLNDPQFVEEKINGLKKFFSPSKV